MRKLDATLIIAIAVAIAASCPASAKGAKSSSTSSSIFKHTVKGEHIKEGVITAKKANKPNNSDISVTKTTDKASAK